MPQLSVHAPLFDLTLYEEDGALRAVDWGWSFGRAHTPLLREAKRQLDAYFDGEALRFDIPLDMADFNDVDYRVLSAIRHIPYGETTTYSNIARQLSLDPDTVEDACLENPLPLFIPCHRVLWAEDDNQDALGDYAGGVDAPVKRELLVLEGVWPAG